MIDWRRTAPYLLLFLALTVSALILLDRRSGARVRLGEAYESQGRTIDAVEQYEWAIQSYTPLSRNPGRAADRIRRIAIEAEREGDKNLALEAWQALHSGLTVIESAWQPYPELHRESRERLDLLLESPRTEAPTENSTPAASSDAEPLIGEEARE